MKRYFFALLLGLTCTAATQSAAAEFCNPSAGILASVLVDDEPVLAVDGDQVTIRRDGSSIDVENGMPLCPDDNIHIADGSVLKINAGEDGDSTNEITVVGEADFDIRNRTGLLARIGRFFGLIRGDFSIRDNHGNTYGAGGTQFEIDFGDAVTVVQLDGDVIFRAPGAADEDVVVVQASQRLQVADGRADTPPEPLPREECARVTRLNSDIFLRSRARLPVRNTVEALDVAERPGTFVEAREQLLCDNNAAAISAVSRAYADWEHPGIDIDAVPGIPPELTDREKAQLQADRAESYRMTGRFDEAMRGFRSAAEFDGDYGVAYLGMARTVSDRAVAAFDPEDSNSAQAVLEQLVDSEAYVRRSLGGAMWGMNSPHNRAVGIMQLAEIELLRAALDPENGTERVSNAQQLYEQAQEAGGTSALFAQVGLARVEVLRGHLIPGTRIVGDDSSEVLRAQLVADIVVNFQRRSHWTNARDRLRELLDDNPAFSAGKAELGRIHLLLNDRRDARRTLRSAIRYNPDNLSAYGILVEVMANDGDFRDERRMLRSTYQNAVTPQRRQVTTAVAQIRQSPPVEPEQVDMLALAASPSRVSLDNITDSSVSVTLSNTGNQDVTVGTIAVRGNQSSAFRVTSRTCTNATLGSGDDCVVVVSITAQDEGSYRATLVVESSGGVDTRVPLNASVRRAYVVQ